MIRHGRLHSGIVKVLIDNPARRNALDLSSFTALAQPWPELASDRGVRAIVITGAGDQAFCAGDQAFCAGADLSANLTDQTGFADIVAKALLKTELMPKPLIAAINGHCLAGGLELALAADIRIASNKAKFGLPEVKWGLIPSAGGTMKLVDQIGHAAAMDLLLTGRLIDGAEAEKMGLVTLSCKPSEVWARAIDRAEMIAAASPHAVRAAKQAALSDRAARYAQQEAREQQIAAELWATGHVKIGSAAFLAKQTPVYGND
jgi:enoyl-CoA hydratase/carnithine racemase